MKKCQNVVLARIFAGHSMMRFTWCLNTTFFICVHLCPSVSICVHLWLKNLLLHGYGSAGLVARQDGPVARATPAWSMLLPLVALERPWLRA